MSSKNHSCIFFLGLDTYCEGAISQVDDAMLSVIAKLKNPVLKSHYLRKSRIARHSSKNRIFFYFAKTSLLVT